MDNIEKLIQMATIEHMYALLQKMKNDNVINQPKEYNFSDEKYSSQNNSLIGSLQNEISHLKQRISDINAVIMNHDDKLLISKEEYWKLAMKVTDLEREINEIKSNTNNNSKFLCQQIREQQKLTSYPGFSNGSSKDEAHIKLKIEEKESNDTDEESNDSGDTEEALNEQLSEEEYEDETDEEDVNPLMITCSTISLNNSIVKKEETIRGPVESVEAEVEAESEEEEEKEQSEEDEEKEQSEEEVGTEDESENLGKVETKIANNIQKEEEEEQDKELSVGEELGKHIEAVTESINDKHNEEVEEEEEEVFEIEIDDVTYFATGEENGILYEMTSDGDIGKKVGIIKDGEPIFN